MTNLSDHQQAYPSRQLATKIAAGDLTEDQAQMTAARRLDDLIDEALGNIRDDRKVAREFLNEIANQIAVNSDNNKYLSPVAAKHIETMQRSNEQLVKIIGLQQKTQAQGFELSDVDKDNLFDMIQGGAED